MLLIREEKKKRRKKEERRKKKKENEERKETVQEESKPCVVGTRADITRPFTSTSITPFSCLGFEVLLLFLLHASPFLSVLSELSLLSFRQSAMPLPVLNVSVFLWSVLFCIGILVEECCLFLSLCQLAILATVSSPLHVFLSSEASSSYHYRNFPPLFDLCFL